MKKDLWFLHFSVLYCFHKGFWWGADRGSNPSSFLRIVANYLVKALSGDARILKLEFEQKPL